MLILFSTILIFSLVSSETVILEECMKNAQNEFDNALLNPPKFTVSDEFKDIKDLINLIKIIIFDIKPTKKLDELFGDAVNKLKKLPNQLKLFREAYDVLKKIEASADKLQKQKVFNQDTEKTCSAAKNRYDNISKDLEEVRKLGSQVNATIVKWNIDRINEESFKVKKSLDELKVPINLDEKYLCEKNILEIFKAIKEVSFNIKKLLEIIKENIRSELQELTNKLKPPPINEDIPDMPFTKLQLQDAIKYVKRNLKKAEKLRDLIEKKKITESDFENLEKIVCNLHKNDVCKIVIPVPVEN
ncbi:uncharacterized protein LOC130904041 [Diorhabda carinulata]|uniref:uncharacterized protein LOC130904041 n=1 Tax=Diorhabda carinulata TaxID=1163345 RepID=UPI0025A203E8|nr:uncharacterized protein LOC130904041 [Diorhabda carinulata]